MSWQNKTRGSIILTSPEGNVYDALWKGDERSGEKKLGRFDPPNFQGTIAQDLGSRSASYPLTIYFQGLNHHIEAEKFFKSCQNEVGIWSVIHPTKGTVQLQLESYKESIQPVENGNYTAFELQCFEPALNYSVISSEQSILTTLSDALDAIEDGINQAKQLRTDAYAAVQSAINQMNKIKALYESLTNIAATDAIVNDAFESAKAAYTSAVETFKDNPSDATAQESVYNALIDIITIPLQANSDYQSRISTYAELNAELITYTPTHTTQKDFNSVLMLELSIIGSLVAFCRIVVTSKYTIRTEIISAMDKLTSLFNDSINSLETVQSLFSDEYIDRQYFSQSTAYTKIMKMFTSTMMYLTNQFYSAKTAKIITLKKNRNPVEVTITEYGENNFDSNYELFITSNQITGSEIQLLPAGKQVIIYV